MRAQKAIDRNRMLPEPGTTSREAHLRLLGIAPTGSKRYEDVQAPHVSRLEWDPTYDPPRGADCA